MIFRKLLLSNVYSRYRKTFLMLADILLISFSYLASWLILMRRITLADHVFTMLFSGLCFIAVFFLVLISPVFAQNRSQDDSSIYYVNLSIERIFPSNQGYIVMYRTQRGVDTLGIPNSWFFKSGGRADIVNLPAGSSAWPTMSVFYSDGEVSHIRLYVKRNRGHITWGSIPLGTDLSRYFPEDESITIRF